MQSLTTEVQPLPPTRHTVNNTAHVEYGRWNFCTVLSCTGLTPLRLAIHPHIHMRFLHRLIQTGYPSHKVRKRNRHTAEKNIYKVYILLFFRRTGNTAYERGLGAACQECITYNRTSLTPLQKPPIYSEIGPLLPT